MGRLVVVMFSFLAVVAGSSGSARAELRTAPDRPGIYEIGDPIMINKTSLEHEMRMNTNLASFIENYGWPEASYGSHYGGAQIPDDHRGKGFEEPKVWWNPSISPGGLRIYRGRLFRDWRGDAFIPALSGQALIRVDIDGDNARKADQWDLGKRIRAVDEGPRGELYLLEDGPRARLLRLEPKS